MTELYFYPVFLELFFFSLGRDFMSFLNFFYNLFFQYCPVYYQFGYGYCMLIYFIRRKIAARKGWVDFFENSSTNYTYLTILFFFKKVFNLNVLFHFFKISFKKIIFFIKHIFLTNHRHNIIYYYIIIREYLFMYFWRPIFKKLSYIGVFAFIRSKWYKNK